MCALVTGVESCALPICPWSPSRLMEQRNLLFAIVLSLAIMLGFQFLFPPATPPQQPQEQEQQQVTDGATTPSGSVPHLRPEARRAGAACVCTSRSRWPP